MFRIPSRSPWSEVESDDEDMQAGSSAESIAIPAADSVEYARLVFPLNDTDWMCPETGIYLINMNLDQLMSIRR
eukprot:16279829-Heterocapsa_arctica.AAC.1